MSTEEPASFTSEMAQQAIAASSRAEFGPAVDELTIRKAEEKLGQPFPPSYRWFLRNYGGGEISGYELAGLVAPLYEPNSEDIVASGDILYLAEMQVGKQDRRYLRLLSFDGDEEYAFDTESGQDTEWPVVVSYAGSDHRKIFATNFYEFIWRILQ